MKTTCPLNGESECDGCKFYTKDFTRDWTCTFTAALSHLNELCHNMRNVADTTEQHRETNAQFIKSAIKDSPTDELLRLTGLKDAAH